MVPVPDTRWDDLVEVLGEGGHASLLGKVGGHRQAQELLQNSNQTQRNVGSLPLLKQVGTYLHT